MTYKRGGSGPEGKTEVSFGGVEGQRNERCKTGGREVYSLQIFFFPSNQHLAVMTKTSLFHLVLQFHKIKNRCAKSISQTHTHVHTRSHMPHVPCGTRHIRNVANFTHSESLYSRKRDLYFAKQPHILAKEPCILTKECVT